MIKGHPDMMISQWVVQLRAGDRNAFDSLYRSYSKTLLYNIKRLVANDEDAQEILQDTFLKIWEIRSKLDPDRSFNGLLIKISKNLVFNHLRNWALRINKQEIIKKDLPISYSHVEEQLIYKESAMIVHYAIAQLSEQCKKVYTLSKIDGRSHQEISELLHISLATVNNHIVKGNQQVRKFLLNHSETLSSFILFLFAFLLSL